MLKLLGAMLILAAGTLFGFFQSMQLAARPRQIRELIQVLQRLETEIRYGFTPLPEALRSAGRSLSEPVAAIFLNVADRLEEPAVRTAADVWKEAVQSGWERTAMKDAEREVLLHLGTTLGISDREDQIKHLQLAASHLLAEEKTAAEEQKRYGSMWKSLGVLAGALLVIIMY